MRPALPPPTEDETLVERARGGDIGAFTSLVGLYHARVRAYLGACFGGTVGRDVVEDAAQETFLDAFRTLGSFKGEGSFASWLFGIARHRALRHLRASERRERSFMTLLQERLGEGTADENRAPLAWHAHEDAAAALLRCLEALPERNARLVRAHYFEGRSLVTLAAEQSQTPGAVRVAVLRIRLALRQCVQRRLGMEAKS